MGFEKKTYQSSCQLAGKRDIVARRQRFNRELPSLSTGSVGGLGEFMCHQRIYIPDGDDGEGEREGI